MIKDKYLEPFLSKEGEREIVLTHGIRSKYIVEFLRFLTMGTPWLGFIHLAFWKLL